MDSLKGNEIDFVSQFHQSGISAEYNWETDYFTLTYVGGFRTFSSEYERYTDYSGINIFALPGSLEFGQNTDDIETWTHELRLQGEVGRLDWLVGIYYSDEQIEEEFPLQHENEYDLAITAQWWPTIELLSGLAGVPDDTPLPLGNGTVGDVFASLNQQETFAGVNSFGSYANNLFEQDAQSFSVFTHNTFHVTDKLDLVVGLRYVDDEKEGSFVQLGANSEACINSTINGQRLDAQYPGAFFTLSSLVTCFPFSTQADVDLPPDIVNTLPVTFDQKWEDDELVYTGKGVYRFNDNVSSYVSFTHGYKAGGFNLDATAAAAGGSPQFDSELIDMWEIGAEV